MKNPEHVAELLAELKAECEYRFEFDAVATVAKAVSELPRVTVIDDEHQEFLGKIYIKRPRGGHYFCGSHSIHRDVWCWYYGEIPKDYVIHHIDGNKSNNNLANLQLMSNAAHTALHFSRKTLAVCEICGRTFLTSQNKPRTTCSAKCYDKKRYNAGLSKNPNRAFEQRVCAICGKKFTVRKDAATKTCSQHCTNQLHRQTLNNQGLFRTVTRICAICGKEYIVRSDSKGKTCSASCATKLRIQNRKSPS